MLLMLVSPSVERPRAAKATYSGRGILGDAKLFDAPVDQNLDNGYFFTLQKECS